MKQRSETDHRHHVPGGPGYVCDALAESEARHLADLRALAFKAGALAGALAVIISGLVSALVSRLPGF